MRKVFLLVALLLLPVFGHASGKEEKEGPVIEYLDMDPKFTINLAEPKKYIMVHVQLLVEGAEAVEAIKKHMPMLRHKIIMLMSGMHANELQTMEQREALRDKTKETLKEALKKIDADDGFEDVFFSEFLVN